jgi:hypothetical protein
MYKSSEFLVKKTVLKQEPRKKLLKVFDLQLLYAEGLCVWDVEHRTRRIGISDVGFIVERDMRNGRDKIPSRRRDVRVLDRRKDKEFEGPRNNTQVSMNDKPLRR